MGSVDVFVHNKAMRVEPHRSAAKIVQIDPERMLPKQQRLDVSSAGVS
jgi:hypothetical protein